MRIDALASRAHYAEHIAPVWRALAVDERGTFYANDDATRRALARWDIDAGYVPGGRRGVLRRYRGDGAIVASSDDRARASAVGLGRLIRLEHGIGQSYSGRHPAYAGGIGQRDVALFLTPNESSAARWAAAYPKSLAVAVGSPFAETIGRHIAEPWRLSPYPRVAVTFHWDHQGIAELRSALPHYAAALPALAERYRVVGHAHPRAAELVGPAYAAAGIPLELDYRLVLASSDVLIADNTSAIYEAAAAGLRVIVLDAPWYRRNVEHGLRFWAAADVDIRISEPEQLLGAVELAARPQPVDDLERRDNVLALVYAHRTGAARRAADAIRAAIVSEASRAPAERGAFSPRV